MRDAAEAMADGDYTVRVHVDANSRDEVGTAGSARSTRWPEELQHADQMRRDMVANVSHELRTPVSALQAMVENMADGVVEPDPIESGEHSQPNAPSVGSDRVSA